MRNLALDPPPLTSSYYKLESNQNTWKLRLIKIWSCKPTISNMFFFSYKLMEIINHLDCMVMIGRMLFYLCICVSIFYVMVVIQDEDFVYAYFFVIWASYVLFVVVYICFVRSLVWVFGSNLPSSVTLFTMLNRIMFHGHLNCSVWAESVSSHLYFLFMRIFFFIEGNVCFHFSYWWKLLT